MSAPPVPPRNFRFIPVPSSEGYTKRRRIRSAA